MSVHTCSGLLILSTCALASLTSWWLLLVERATCLVLIMWPFSVAVGDGRCLAMSSYVRPGIESSCLLCIALRSDDLEGNQRHWCKYIANSSLVLVVIILATISWAPLARSRWSLIGYAIGGCSGGVILGPVFNVIGMVSNGTIHSPVRLHFCPCSIIRPW